MKFLLMYAITLIGFQAVGAQGALEKIPDAEVMIFDATCTPTSAAEAYMTVQLRVESKSSGFSASGNFRSYVEALRTTNRWSLMPLQACHRAASQLSLQAGRRLAATGEVYIESYEALEHVYGTCRESPRIGGTYPCEKGTKLVTKYRREVVLNVSGINLILNEE